MNVKAHVEHHPDPRNPNRIVYRITGQSRECVQAKIDEITNRVSGGIGDAGFFGPSLIEGEYRALGEVIVFERAGKELHRWFGP